VPGNPDITISLFQSSISVPITAAPNSRQSSGTLFKCLSTIKLSIVPPPMTSARNAVPEAFDNKVKILFSGEVTAPPPNVNEIFMFALASMVTPPDVFAILRF